MDLEPKLGADSFQVGFFQEYWNIVGEDVIEAVKNFFSQNSSITSINHTFIMLIPKIKCPESMLDFRPICLCNVFYKIIAKSMANRIKEVFFEIISPLQSAFVNDLQIIDNIIIVHKMLWFFKRDKSSSNHHMAIKIDMNKAYDRIKWDKNISMMERVGFNHKWRV